MWLFGAGLVVLGILAFIVLAPAWFGSPSGTSSSTSGSTSVSSTSTKQVLYEVEGTVTAANITYQTPSGTAQGSNKKVPLGAASTGKRGISLTMEPGDFIYISAQNTQSTGTITCIISVDGRVVSKVTSSGAYSIASCNSKVPY